MRVQKNNKAFAYRVPIGDYNYLQCTIQRNHNQRLFLFPSDIFYRGLQSRFRKIRLVKGSIKCLKPPSCYSANLLTNHFILLLHTSVLVKSLGEPAYMNLTTSNFIAIYIKMFSCRGLC